jgi:hypothetical protein
MAPIGERQVAKEGSHRSRGCEARLAFIGRGYRRERAGRCRRVSRVYAIIIETRTYAAPGGRLADAVAAIPHSLP